MNEQTIDLPVAVVPREQPHAVVRLQDHAMSVAEIIGQVKLIQEVMGKVMQENVHYGTIPGCGDKKTLLQPGAQKLTMTFRLAPEYQIQETNHPGGHKEYRVVCTLKSISSGAFVGQGVGVCSTLEAKYRYRGGSRKCPDCGKETIIKGKAEYGGGWLCFAKKGGCGSKWVDGAAEIESQSVERQEHDNPADFYNTVLKMGKKRAFVDATITATASSDFLTQDIGDDESDLGPEQPSKTPQDAPRAAKAPAVTKTAKMPESGKSAPKTKAAVQQDEKGWDAFLAACKNRLLEKIDRNFEWAWWRYAVDRNWILPTAESLADARPDKMFEGFDKTNANTAKDSVSEIFKKHTAAVDAMAAACPPEMREELLRGMTPMNQTAVPQGQELPKAPRLPSKVCCPVCRGTAIKKHKDLIGCSWCEKDGTMWQDSDPTEGYEEHEWMWARLPFAPKDDAKKSYKGKTLGQLSRLDPRYWFGTVMNFEAKEFKGHPPSQESVDFADACEQARKHLDDVKNQTEGTGDKGEPTEDDDIPF